MLTSRRGPLDWYARQDANLDERRSPLSLFEPCCIYSWTDCPEKRKCRNERFVSRELSSDDISRIKIVLIAGQRDRGFFYANVTRSCSKRGNSRDSTGIEAVARCNSNYPRVISSRVHTHDIPTRNIDLRARFSLAVSPACETERNFRARP